MASPPVETPRGSAPPTAKPPGLGSQGVVAVKICAAVLGVIILIYYILVLSYSESPYWLMGVIVGVIGLGLGIAGVFIGNISISRRKNIPNLNIIFINGILA